MEEQEKYALFDRYLRGDLSQQELDDFLERLKEDPELAADLEMHKFLVDGIQEHRKEELRTYMKEKARVRFMGNPWTRNWTYASAAVLLIFGVMYVVIDQNRKIDPVAVKDSPAETSAGVDTTEEKPEDLPEESSAEETPQLAEQQDPVPVVPETEPYKDTSSAVSDEHDVEHRNITELNQENLASMPKEDELPVKSDTRIYDTLITLNLAFIPVQGAKSGDFKDSSGVAKQATTATKDEKITVQYWKSPINYKGYRFDGRKLELFGVGFSDEISLSYLVLDPKLKVYRVYLKKNGLYFPLVDDHAYHPYKAETDPAILEKLK